MKIIIISKGINWSSEEKEKVKRINKHINHHKNECIKKSIDGFCERLGCYTNRICNMITIKNRMDRILKDMEKSNGKEERYGS